MIAKRLFRSLVVGGMAAGVGLLLNLSGLTVPMAFGAAALVLFLINVLPWMDVMVVESAIIAVRAWLWRDEQGRHHSFNGVLLDIRDDGRHVWVAADGLRRAMRGDESDERLEVRFPGRGRRDEQGRLLLRIDAVTAYLHSSNTSRDPTRLRLLRFLENDVLFPAAERRRRSETID